MYGKFVTFLYKRHAEKAMKEVQKLNKKRKDAERYQVLEQMKQLYGFVKFINGQFVNRRERKHFWNSVSKGESVLEGTMERLMNKMKEKNNKK